MEEEGRKSNNHPQTKKNPYIMTIGFDRTDPRHVEVADFLNSLPRKKAEYIVDAVRSYQNQKEEKTIPAVSGVDYHHIRSMVLQILKEQEQKADMEEESPSFKNEELDGIMESLRVFRR